MEERGLDDWMLPPLPPASAGLSCPDYRAEREAHLRQAEAAWREKQGRAGADGVLIQRARKMEKRRRGG